MNVSPNLHCDLYQSLEDDALRLMCTILLERNLDGLFNSEYWYEYTGTQKQILQRRTAIFTAFGFMENTLKRNELRHYTRGILARILEMSSDQLIQDDKSEMHFETARDRLQQFSDEDIDNILRTYRGLYYPLNFFRSAVRELGNFDHWDLDFMEKKLHKSYRMKCLTYNHRGEEWYENSCRPQTMYGTGPHAIIHIRWRNYEWRNHDFGI